METVFQLKYANVFTHNFGSMGTQSRRRIFDRGTNTKRGNVPDFARGDTKINIFQEGRAGFEATIN